MFGSRAKHLCRPDQRNALWEFKNEFYVEESLQYELWRNNTDCCYWDGISCDPKTGKVVLLDLKGSALNGPLRSNSSLFRLQHLHNLYLSYNYFSGTLPHSIGNLKYLRVLSLRECNLFGKIPSSLGNLSYLTDLDLSFNSFSGELPDSMSNLNRLRYLKIVSTKLSGNFPHVLLNWTELTSLDIRSNQFEGMLPCNMSTLTKLEDFEINENLFSGSIPSSLFMIPSLIQLDLGRNDFSGPLEIGNISFASKLKVLFLGENNFNGPIPGSISKLVNLSYLDLSLWNRGRGIVDFSIFLRLKSLTFLDLSYINTRSMVDTSVFSHLLMSLDYLDLSGINLKINSTLHISSSISTLSLSSCNIVEFPNGFGGSASVIQRSELQMLDISSNTFHDLPLLPNSTKFFFGSANQFSGEIPRAVCKLVSLDTLVLSNNNFSGSIPRCFKYFTRISVLHLQNNTLSGILAEGSISDYLRSLNVGHNKLSGDLPKSLVNCTELEFLNVENNRISDTFPFWLGSLPDLQILVLRSNEFYGPISSPGDSLSFPKLRLFDISDNRFTGVLPSDYFALWSAMSLVVDIVEYHTQIKYLKQLVIIDDMPSRYAERNAGNYHNSVTMTAKGLKMVLVGSGFTIFKTIDVPGIRYEGEVPESIGLLKELIVLNMSNNAFVGRIPPSLSNLTNLESLDLSQNKLSGRIPPELGTLTFLERMNFSYNRLEGAIPQGTQFQSQNSSSFAENPRLCGLLLQKTCSREEATKQDDDDEKEEDGIELDSSSYRLCTWCCVWCHHRPHSNFMYWFMRIFHSFT
ncbi:PREDICTED: receptor like protein 30-like [Camelina sativa]|uniref:Receptor like protein 30-like n=1 Tax=Camelina sativa TaxID=90675 RepID=A0ABM0YX21_CAMSA|nr:PREDICTED: receptor like protein 30-like [Camelina sativa]